LISDGAGSIVMLDLKTNVVLGMVAAKDDVDGIVCDKSTGLVLVLAATQAYLITLKADVDSKAASPKRRFVRVL